MAKLVVVCGISFAGKTTLARAIRARLGHAEVDVDATKERLYGAGVEDASLGDEDWRRIYAAADDEIAAHLGARRNGVDASRNFRRFEREGARKVAARVGADFVLVYVDTPVEVARERFRRNRESPTRWDPGEAEFENLARLFEPPAADEPAVVFRHGDDPADWIDANAGVLT